MLSKIITMLQNSRFDNQKEENTFTQKYIFIFISGIWPGGQLGYRTTTLWGNKEISNPSHPPPPRKTSLH